MKLSIMLIVIFLYIPFLSFGQKTPLEEVLKNCIEIHDNYEKLLLKEDTVISFSSFSFNNFKPILSSLSEEKHHFKLYYRNDSIVGIERVDQLNVLYNYKFKATEKNEFIYLSGLVGGDVLEGIFVIDKLKNSIYFLNFWDNKIAKNSLFYRINYIMKLDDDLEPIYKVHFVNKYIDYMSDFYKKGDNLKESIYFSLINKKPIKIDSIQTFSNLDRIFLRKQYTYIFATISPNVRDYNLPLWLYGNYRFK